MWFDVMFLTPLSKLTDRRVSEILQNSSQNTCTLKINASSLFSKGLHASLINWLPASQITSSWSRMEHIIWVFLRDIQAFSELFAFDRKYSLWHPRLVLIPNSEKKSNQFSEPLWDKHLLLNGNRNYLSFWRWFTSVMDYRVFIVRWIMFTCQVNIQVEFKNRLIYIIMAYDHNAWVTY